MAILQSVNILTGLPGIAGQVQPTTASPSPVFGLSSTIVQGVSVYPGTAPYTAGQSVVSVVYFNGNQRFTGTLICTQAAAAIISAS